MKKILIMAIFFAKLLPGMNDAKLVVIEKLSADKIVLPSFKEKYFTHYMLSSYFLNNEMPKEIVDVILRYFFSSHRAEIMAVVEEIAPEIDREIVKYIRYEEMVKYIYASFYRYTIKTGFKFIDFETYISCVIQIYREWFDTVFGCEIMCEYFKKVHGNHGIRLIRLGEIVFRQYPDIGPGSYPSLCASVLGKIIDPKEGHRLAQSKTEKEKIEIENELLLSRATPANKSYAIIALDFSRHNKNNEEQGPAKFKEYLRRLRDVEYIPFRDHAAAIMREENYDNLNFLQYCKEKLSIDL